MKGSPEFELHIMGQLGSSDTLKKYQCIGEHAPVGYVFDQNDLSWSGSVLLFSNAQFDSYKALHPGQSLRIVAMEDDDTACELKTDPDRFAALLKAGGVVYGDLTGAIDSTSTVRIIRAARSLLDFLRTLASWLKSNDDLIGNAVEDKVAGEYHTGANWVIKGENNITNGWIKLIMK